jgi:large subunit ribosomal protein L28e
MSSDLVWLITRNNSSFLVKRNGVQFNSQPSNLLNKQSLKFNDSVAVQMVGDKIVLQLPRKTQDGKVSKAKFSIPLKKVNPAKLDKVLTKVRPDLTEKILARVARLAQIQKAPKPLKEKKIRGSRK